MTKDEQRAVSRAIARARREGYAEGVGYGKYLGAAEVSFGVDQGAALEKLPVLAAQARRSRQLCEECSGAGYVDVERGGSWADCQWCDGTGWKPEAR